MKTIYKVGFSTLIIILLAILAYAYGGTNPAVHGHDSGETDLTPLTIDKVNSRMGVGVSEPSYILDVNGSSYYRSTSSNKALAIEPTPSYINLQSYGSVPLVFNNIGNSVGIGMTNPANTLHVNGNIGATGWIGAGCESACESGGGYVIMFNDGSFVATGSKSFRISHPLDPENKVLVHAAIEGPEAGVYYRGKSKLSDGKKTIYLPDYFEALTTVEDRTIQITSLNGYSPLYVSKEVGQGNFEVSTTEDGNQEQEFYWEVKAVRKDIPPLVVEDEKNEIDGRYLR